MLPERLAIRAVCAMPDTKWGTDEAKGRTEAILEAHGIKFPGADKSEARAPWAAEGSRALAALRRAVGRLGPRPLRAAQHRCAAYEDARKCPMEELDATVRHPIRCSAGFDYQPTSGECVRHTLGAGSTTGGPGNSGNSGSSGGGNTNHHNNQPTVRTVEFALSCTSPTRGSGGSCSVATQDTAVTLGDLSYAWSSMTVGRMGAGSCSGYFFDYLGGFATGEGSGPWDNRWYVASTDDESVAGAFWGTNPELRSDGPEYDTGTLLSSIRSQSGCRSSANVYQVNACSASESAINNRSSAFDDLVDEVEEHETAHVRAVVAEAEKYDVWDDWEAVVAASESAAKTAAQTAASPVQAALLSATQAVDANYSKKTFDIWWWTGREWARRLIRTGH